jgi:hypothetical protein
MRHPLAILTACGLCLAASHLPAQAQSAPPIKPGLWEVQVERDGGQQKMPDVAAHLKNMPPERRQKIEAMMKARGVDMSGGANKLRMCLDKSSLDQGQWQGERDARCKTDMNRGSGKWTWHSVCGEPYHAVTDGEATFSGTDSYVVKTSTTMTIRGEIRTTQTTLRSKWLGADCGDVKPVQAMRRPLDGQAPKQK